MHIFLLNTNIYNNYISIIFISHQYISNKSSFKNFLITSISLCMPMYSLTYVQKGYVVIDLVDGY